MHSSGSSFFREYTWQFFKTKNKNTSRPDSKLLTPINVQPLTAAFRHNKRARTRTHRITSIFNHNRAPPPWHHQDQLRTGVTFAESSSKVLTPTCSHGQMLRVDRNNELTCGRAELSCLCSESLSWLTSCSLLWVRPRFSCVSRSVSRSRSRSSSMDTISDSKWPSESDCSGEPEPLPLPFPGPTSASLIVGITSHIIWGEHTAQHHCYKGWVFEHSRKLERAQNSIELSVFLSPWCDGTIESTITRSCWSFNNKGYRFTTVTCWYNITKCCILHKVRIIIGPGE